MLRWDFLFEFPLVAAVLLLFGVDVVVTEVAVVVDAAAVVVDGSAVVVVAAGLAASTKSNRCIVYLYFNCKDDDDSTSAQKHLKITNGTKITVSFKAHCTHIQSITSYLYCTYLHFTFVVPC